MTGQRAGIKEIVPNGYNHIHIAGLDELFPDIFFTVSGIGSRTGHNKAGSPLLIKVRMKVLNPHIIAVIGFGNSKWQPWIRLYIILLLVDFLHIERRIGHYIITLTC